MRSYNHVYPPCPRCGYEVIPGQQCAHCARQQRHAESTQRLRAGNEANRQEAERLRLERQMQPSSFTSSVPQQSYQSPQQTYQPPSGVGIGDSIGPLIVICIMGLMFVWPYVVAIVGFLFTVALFIGGCALCLWIFVLVCNAIFGKSNGQS